MSTASADVVEPEAAPRREKPRKYGFSALISGLARMWRATLPVVVVILVNAVIQSLLIMSDPPVSASLGFIASVVVSLICILIWYAVITASALGAVEGHVRFTDAFTRAFRHLWGFIIWTVALWIVVIAGLMLYNLPGLIVLAVTPYVPIAAMAGQRNALGANFRAIGGRPVRWIVTIILVGIMASVIHLLAAVNWFFVGGFVAGMIAWVGYGFLAWWWTTTYACLYRSTWVGAEADEDTEAV